ncbi:MAG: gfo/Idh/MocA family oxidoreductase [Spirochaetaceae bacterium]|nr:MAG: gfo/Idh/MocA family oxidoreductase [Spirochaetaceae bacterium]
MSTRKRYAVVGTGGRSKMYLKALATSHAAHGELVALCDLNSVRLDYANEELEKEFGYHPVPAYLPRDFETMISRERVDTVIVTSIDRTHHTYIIRAMNAGCDAITEKPMTTDADKCAAINEAIRRTGKNLTVTFNYRYAPRNARVKEVLMSGAIGDIKSVHFEWLLDTNHGADYFRRWHRDKRNSGGLMVHKATHHFDLVNWWLDSSPKDVYAFGDLVFYGRENAEARGVTEFYDRSTGNPIARRDPFALHMDVNEKLRRTYLEAEGEDGYRRDQSVFSDGISIEDDMSVLVRYNSGATMSYHLTAYSPWEGFRIAFNGSRGRLEYNVTEVSYISTSDTDIHGESSLGSEKHDAEVPAELILHRHWQAPEYIALDESDESGHGGGDIRLLADVFVGSEADPLGRAADHRSGTDSILTGIAANLSMAEGRKIDVNDLRTRVGG